MAVAELAQDEGFGLAGGGERLAADGGLDALLGEVEGGEAVAGLIRDGDDARGGGDLIAGSALGDGVGGAGEGGVGGVGVAVDDEAEGLGTGAVGGGAVDGGAQAAAEAREEGLAGAGAEGVAVL